MQFGMDTTVCDRCGDWLEYDDGRLSLATFMCMWRGHDE